MAVTFFFPATRLLQRGREIEKQDVDEENDIKWQRFEETDYRFTLAHEGGGRGEKSIFSCRQVFPQEQINDPEKSIIHTLCPPPVFVLMSLSHTKWFQASRCRQRQCEPLTRKASHLVHTAPR